MSRFLYITAATLFLFSLIAFAMMFTPGTYQPETPFGGSLWKTAGWLLLVGSLVAAFVGVLTAMFEQVGRRNEERRRREGGTVIEFPGKAGRGQEKYSPLDSSSKDRRKS